MRKQMLALLLVASLGSFSWGSAQTSKTAPFDLKKSQQELQIMKGILGTTLGFVADELHSRESGNTDQKENHLFRVRSGSWGGSNITAYYLYGQGATFVIPISSLRAAFSKGTIHLAGPGLLNLQFGDEMEQLSMDLEAATTEVGAERENNLAVAAQAAADALQASGGSGPAIATGGGTGSGRGTGSGQAAATPKPATKPAAPAAKGPLNQEVMRKKLAEAQEKVKKRREEMEARQQKLLQALAEVKVYLIEALANHGDSLTTVKPNEYINIIITMDEGVPFFSEDGGARAPQQVISAQKSWISDYKAGRLTMEAFKQKVLQYES